MQLSKYISDLLYRYECVIVPGFGGFVSNKISSTVNEFTHTFSPPTKKLSFNRQLLNNDGLLANYISLSESISFEEAVSKIDIKVSQWEALLENEHLFLNGIGTLDLNKENNLVFEPLESTNFLTSSFGLESFQSQKISRSNLNKETIQIQSRRKTSPTYLKYAAAITVLLTVGSLGWNSIEQKKAADLATQQRKVISTKIEEATFFINNPLPAINLDVVKKELPKKFHLIAGAFGQKANAYRKVNQLKQKGFNAQIVGVNKWGLTQVSFESYTTREEAIDHLQIIKKSIAKDAWLYIK